MFFYFQLDSMLDFGYINNLHYKVRANCIMIPLLIIGTLCYIILLIILFIGISRNKKVTTTTTPSISVLVAARDEETRIGACLDALLAQDYPKENIEIIVIDDNSCDSTADIVNQYHQQDSRIKLISAGLNPDGLGPKKNALRWGIQASRGDLIVTTDADCTPPVTWLTTMVSYFQDTVGVVAGPSILIADDHWIRHWLVLENLGNIAIYAGSTGLGFPMGAQGANLAYRRQVWDELGFGDQGRTFSGDDDLFVQRVARNGKWKVRYALKSSASVPHHHHLTGKNTIHQKRRHLSVIRWYRKEIVGLAALVALYHVFLALGLVLGLFSLPILVIWFGCTVIKTIGDGLILMKTARKLSVRIPLFWLPFAEILRPWVMLFMVPWSWLAPVSWKGRVRSAAPVPNSVETL